MEFICFAFYVLGSALQVGSVSFVGSVVYHSSTSGRVSSGYQTPSLLDQVMYIVGFISSRIPERERERELGMVALNLYFFFTLHRSETFGEM